MKLNDILHKVKHQYGRNYGAYLTPVELLEIAKSGAVCRKSDIILCWDRKKNGEMIPNWYYFDINENTELYKSLKG